VRLTARPVTAKEIWQYLASEATVDGSLGKLIADYLDAKVSEVVKQICSTEHPTDSIGKLLKDFLDEKVSNVKTVADGIKSTVDTNLDDKISTLTSRLTEARSSALDKIYDADCYAGANPSSLGARVGAIDDRTLELLNNRLTAERAAKLDNLDAKVSEAKGFYVEEVYDDILAGGASITPTVNGIFTAVHYANNLKVEIYSDADARWLPMLHDVSGSYSSSVRQWNGVVGEANKIRITNTSDAARPVVVNRAY